MKLTTKKLRQLIKEELMEMMEDPMASVRHHPTYKELTSGGYESYVLARSMEQPNPRFYTVGYGEFDFSVFRYPIEPNLIKSEISKNPSALTEEGMVMAAAIIDLVRRGE